MSESSLAWLTDASNALNSVVGLASAIAGSNTTSNVVTNGKGTTTTDSLAETSSLTKLGADPEVIAALKALAAQAVSNSTNSNNTNDLLSGILQKAGDAMTGTFGRQKQSGLYNSSSTIVQNNDIMSRAAADAAQAILGYRTSQQTLAENTYKQLADITATKSDAAVAKTHSEVIATNESTSQKTEQKAGLSMICTFMHKKKLLSNRKYITSTRDFMLRPWYVRAGYLVIARPLVAMLERGHDGIFAKMVMKIFAARTDYICSKYNIADCHVTPFNWLANAIIICACFFPALWLLIKDTIVNLYYAKEGV